MNNIVRKQREENHGLSGTPEYEAWSGMRMRCTNKNKAQFKDYGGRGIKICDGWYYSFMNFYNQMGTKPDKSLTLDRINNNYHYSCGQCKNCIKQGWLFNCRWATRFEQSWNKRKYPNRHGYSGITRRNNKWIAQISIGEIAKIRRNFVIGRFKDIEEAALAYDKAVIFFRGYEGVTNIL